MQINAGDLNDKAFVEDILAKGQKVVDEAAAEEEKILKMVATKI